MLENQPWIKYAEDLRYEWRQANDEGRDVEYLKDICEKISQDAKNNDYESLAGEIREKLISSRISDSYEFDEPSELDAIKASRPKQRRAFTNCLTEEQLKDKLYGAWIGRISGCLLGKPVECMKRKQIEKILKETGNFPMSRYITSNEFSEKLKEDIGNWQDRCWADRINGISPVDDDTNYTVFAMKLIDSYGKDFTSNDVLDAWLNWIPMFATCTAERAAYRNAATGLLAPETATYNNPFREWIGAQIRGDFFGYINPANPELAAEMAWRDARISHVKNGIYGEMFIAAMLAAAVVCDDMPTVIRSGLDQVPEKCRLRKDIELVLQWHGEGLTFTQAVDNIHESRDEGNSHDWCHTTTNAMVVAAALLWSGKDFGKAVCMAVQAGFDTDCNGATVGSVLGIMLGVNGIPPYWHECYNKRLMTNISGYNEVTVDQLVCKTYEIVTKERK